MKGKQKCEILKEIRKKIAEENDIKIITDECKHKGECKGTCPKCEEEVKQLEDELNKRKSLGKSVLITGAAVAVVATIASCSGIFDDICISIPNSKIEQTEGSIAPVELEGDIAYVPTTDDDFILEPPNINDDIAIDDNENGDLKYGR